MSEENPTNGNKLTEEENLDDLLLDEIPLDEMPQLDADLGLLGDDNIDEKPDLAREK